MDKITHEVRLSNWKAVIESCQSRPHGQTAKQWLSENGISEKQYYYWLRRIRQEAYRSEITNTLPTVTAQAQADVVLTEIPGIADAVPEPVSGFKPDVVVRVMSATIELSNSASAVLISRIIKAVTHAV